MLTEPTDVFEPLLPSLCELNVNFYCTAAAVRMPTRRTGRRSDGQLRSAYANSGCICENGTRVRAYSYYRRDRVYGDRFGYDFIVKLT